MYINQYQLSRRILPLYVTEVKCINDIELHLTHLVTRPFPFNLASKSLPRLIRAHLNILGSK